jgi:aspartate aminotransferase
VTQWTVSPNLALNQDVAKRQAAGESIVHMGFGEARLPTFPPLIERLAAGAGRTGYGPVAGGAAVRAEIAGYFARRSLPTEPDQVVLAPGSKALLLAIDLAVPGDVLLPRPAWNTYAPQARLAGKRTRSVPIPAEYGGIPDPVALRDTIAVSRRHGEDPRILVLTLPDNPTGTVAPPALVRAVCSVATEEDLLIISDEIYRDLVHDASTPVLGPAEVAPERTIVTTGLSKSLALGGWRIGAARFPAGQWGSGIRDAVVSIASETWSALSGPMQAVAEYAFAEPPELRSWIRAGARLHGVVARAVHEIFIGVGAAGRAPTAGFYVYPDFEPLREVLVRTAVTDSLSLSRRLLNEFGIAVLAGHHLGDDPAALRFKAATSMLYGATARQQRQALDADDPLAVPHVADVLARIEQSCGKLCH